MNSEVLDNVKLNWNPDNTVVLNFAIAFIMFGVALGLTKSNFVELYKNPRSTFTGIISQFLLLPMFTFAMVWVFDPLPGLALGMILVAACPGGNLSNFFSALSKGNVALSISLTAAASIFAVFLTPFNFEFWGSRLDGTSAILKKVNIDLFQMIRLVFFTIALPLMLGLLVKSKLPRTATKLDKPIRYLSFAILIGFIAVAFASNYDLFLEYYHLIILLVLFHNALALAIGYFFSKMMQVSAEDTKSITIETGIQNSGLGLLIIFTVFNGQGAMALIAAWWGIWHIISGLIISQYFAYQSTQPAIAE